LDFIDCSESMLSVSVKEKISHYLCEELSFAYFLW